MEKPRTMTIAEFRALVVEPLRLYADTDLISIGGGRLSFYRLKTRGDHLVDMEFNQVFEVPDDA